MMLLAPQPFECAHCKKRFMAEKTLMAHMCEPKRRAMQQGEKRVQIGYMAWNRWYELSQKQKKPKSYEEFCKSSYYNAFVKFGSFVSNVNPLYPEKFIDFVIRSDVKLDHWSRDELYETYLYEMLKIEPVENAVQRTLTTMLEWADANNAVWTHYFAYASPNRIVQNIVDGKISPWVILNCGTGKTALESMSDEQLEIIQSALDIPHWLREFKKRSDDVEFVKEVCKESGIG